MKTKLLLVIKRTKRILVKTISFIVIYKYV